MVGFIFGGDTKETPESLKRKRSVAEALAAKSNRAPKNVGEGIASIGDAILYRSLMGKVDAGEAAGRESVDADRSALLNIFGIGGGAGSTGIPSPSGADSVSIAPVEPTKSDMTGNQVYGDFINTVKEGGVKNPYALAAIAATGKAESGFSPGNVNRTWDDPSESGQPGRAGGIMSWRGPRYEALAATGDLSPAGQAKFFLQEDPQLIEKLNGAKSVEEAQGLMNQAWAFKGYDRPGGEAARRMGLAAGFLPEFQGQGAPAQVASLDPTAGLPQPGAAAAIEATAPGSGYPQVTTAARKPSPSVVAALGPNNAIGPRQPSPVAAALTSVPVPTARPEVPPPGEMETTTAAAAPRNTQVAQALIGNPQAGAQVQQAMKLLRNPYATDEDKQIAMSVLERAQKVNDPAYQLQLRKTQLDVEEAERGKWERLNDGRLYNQRTGEVKDTPGGDYISPADRARMDLERQKFDADKQTNAEKLTLDKDKFAADKENNALTPDLKEYDAYVKGETSAGRQPLSLLDYQLAVKKAGASSTNVTTGEGSSFYKKLDEKNAETYAALSDTGMQSRAKMAQIDRLEGLMKNAPQGGIGVLKQTAGEWGIPTEGLSDIQAASALLEKMVPAQRAPGSGPMSDADIKMFRSSLPRVINQPGGNQLIFQTLRGITQYEIQMGEIADRVANREIEPSEARRQIQELKNPLADYKISDGPTPNKGTTSTGIPWSFE